MLLVVVPCPDLPAQPSGTSRVNHAGGLWQCSTSGTHATQACATTAHFSLFYISVPGFPPLRMQPYGNRRCSGLQPITGGRCSKQVHSLHSQNKPPVAPPLTTTRWEMAVHDRTCRTCGRGDTFQPYWWRVPGYLLVLECSTRGNLTVNTVFCSSASTGHGEGIETRVPLTDPTSRRGLPSSVFPSLNPDMGSQLKIQVMAGSFWECQVLPSSSNSVLTCHEPGMSDPWEGEGKMGLV